MNTPANKTFENLSRGQRIFLIIVALASGLGLGGMLALSEALRTKDATFSLPFLVKTAIAFVLGFTACFAYLSRILVHRERASRLFVRGGLIVNITLVVAAFIYPLRIDQLAVRLPGPAIALCLIAGGLTLIRLVVRATEREEAEEETKEAKENAGSDDVAPRT